MSLLFETLIIENGNIRNLKHHNERLNRSRSELFGAKKSIDLSEAVDLGRENMRCKVIYDTKIRRIEYYPLKKRTFRCFKIIESDIEYSYKYLDRSKIDKLYEMRGECDDIIIVRDGKVLDTSIANIAYWDDKRWITPVDPLLAGTMRASLLDEGKIIEGDVTVEDILEAEKMAVMNAIVGMSIVDELKIRM